MQTKLKNTGEALLVAVMALGMFLIGIGMGIFGIDIIAFVFNLIFS